MAAYYLLLFALTFVVFGSTQSKDVRVHGRTNRLQQFMGNIASSVPHKNFQLNNEVSKEIVLVYLFYETMCPGCRQFDTTYFSELIHKLGDHLSVITIPYGKAATTKYYNGTLTFWCQHGELECYGNKLHGCAHYYFAQEEKEEEYKSIHFNTCLMDLERSENGSNDDAVDECGSKMNISDKVLANIKSCAKSDLGDRIFEFLGEYSLLKYTSLPHVELNLEPWTGKHEDLIKDVCALFKNPPEPCKDVK
ncbi:GILT-like protein 1 [Ostrinia nubilalis]|uniref:GILT-like protein 1 n=1 Tax=Ostrinia nubilalis TaxID=29057 RepID=UPI0030824E21